MSGDPVPQHLVNYPHASESAKLEWACREIERLHKRVAELENKMQQVLPDLN